MSLHLCFPLSDSGLIGRLVLAHRGALGPDPCVLAAEGATPRDYLVSWVELKRMGGTTEAGLSDLVSPEEGTAFSSVFALSLSLLSTHMRILTNRKRQMLKKYPSHA